MNKSMSSRLTNGSSKLQMDMNAMKRRQFEATSRVVYYVFG